jgi:hypothetical protein
MKIEVTHHKDSEYLINQTFEMYAETNEFPYTIEGRCIIHLYPESDTITDDGLEGYQDAMNCKLAIFDCERRVVYYSKRMHDSVFLLVPSSVKVFKDLSTMIIIDGGVNLSRGQGIIVDKM